MSENISFAQSEDTAFAQHKLACTAGAMETTDSEDTSEKNIELGTGGEAEGGVGGNGVRVARPENEPPHPSGGLKAWLFVLATFLIFISAW